MNVTKLSSILWEGLAIVVCVTCMRDAKQKVIAMWVLVTIIAFVRYNNCRNHYTIKLLKELEGIKKVKANLVDF